MEGSNGISHGVLNLISVEGLLQTCLELSNLGFACLAAQYVMPGLLQTPGGSLRSYKTAYAFLAEMVGTMIFSLYGSATTLSGAETLGAPTLARYHQVRKSFEDSTAVPS